MGVVNLQFQSATLGIRHNSESGGLSTPFAFAFEYDDLTVGAHVSNAVDGLRLEGFAAVSVSNVFDQLFNHIETPPGSRQPLDRALHSVIAPGDIVEVTQFESGTLDRDWIIGESIRGIVEMKSDFEAALKGLGRGEFVSSIDLRLRTAKGELVRYPKMTDLISGMMSNLAA